MNIQEPAWRKRSRPCPFFSQGRCLFADSCNFLHGVETRSAVTRSLLDTVQVQQPSIPVFEPPSVIVNSASPSPVNIASPVQDSSRYSALLSVLSDVIDPPLNPPITTGDHVPGSQVVSASSSSDQSSILQTDSEDALVVPIVGQTEPGLPQVSSGPVAEGQSGPDEDTIGTSCYFTKDTQRYEIGSGVNEDMGDQDEDEPMVAISKRQSTFSSFTGASLLASPRNSVFEDSSVTSPIEESVVDLLSPVQLSAKLRPFPIPSPRSKLKRGDSVNSGYAGGDTWVSPRPFPHSPPRIFRSSMTLLSHARRGSHSSPTPGDRKVFHDVSAIRASSRSPIEAIQEVESDDSSVDNVDTACAILGAYDTSSQDQRGDGAGDVLQVNIAKEKSEDNNKPSKLAPAVKRSLRQYSLDHLRPTREYALDSCNQPSFVFDDNLSKTTLSSHPSCGNLSDISQVSPTKRRSLSHLSGCSTPNTSVLSHYDEANEQSSVESSRPTATPSMSIPVGGVGVSEARALECSHPEKISVDSEGVWVQEVLGHSLQHADGEHNHPGIVAPHGHSFGVVHPVKRLQESSPSTESSRSPSPVEDVFGYALVATSDVQEYGSLEHSSALLNFKELPFPKLSSPVENSVHSSSDKDVFGYAPLHPDRTVIHHYWAECVIAETGKSPVSEGGLGCEEYRETSDAECDNFTQRLSFPLPPPFLPVKFVKHSTLSGKEDTRALSEAATSDIEEGTLRQHMVSQHEARQRLRSGSDLTEKARPSEFFLVGSPDPSPDFASQRSRAASDLTVRGESLPATTLVNTPYMLESSPSAEQPGQSDSVQSLYDQYFDDGIHGDSSKPFAPPHKDNKDNASPYVSSSVEIPFYEVQHQSSDFTPHIFQQESIPYSNSKSSNFGADSSQSETVFRPLLTGRRSFLRSPLAELIPETKSANTKVSSPVHPSVRLQVREIGSSMVPLGFRRHKPQPMATQSPLTPAQPLHAVLRTSELREVLRIRTDVGREDVLPGYSSANLEASFTTRSPLPAQSISAPPTSGLKELHLSSIISKRSSILSTHSSSIAPSIFSLDRIFNSSTPHSPSVSSDTSFSHNSLFSSSCEPIPEHTHHTFQLSSPNTLIPQAPNDPYFTSQPSSTRRDSRFVTAPIQQPKSWRSSHCRAGSRNYISADGTPRFSRKTSTLSFSDPVDERPEFDHNDSTTPHLIQSQQADDLTRPASVPVAPAHAIATPKPTLLFAIASDNVNQVRRVLESGEAGPNDSVGPQSALAFTLTNDKLTHKQEIVKALLAYGANPSALRNPALNPSPRREGSNEPGTPPPETTLEGMDPATRYFVTRADAAHTRQTSQLIYRSFFRPLTRVRYDVIGQDWALEQLFRVLSLHSQKLAVAPIVVLLCGPSGHGKSLLARKFGSILDVPTHTVNMTTLRSAHDIWQSYSMSPYEEPSSCTLAEFLVENEGKRCVIVLDEIEKVEDQKALWSLLMPWELGRCSLGAGKRHVDARNVIWLGTSNIGHELVFDHHENRAEPDERMSREEYFELTAMLRPHVSHCLGASLVSRVTTVLPFVPFTQDEKKAIAAEAIYALAGDASRTMSSRDVESLVTKALPNYHPGEGARSLHRAISNILIDVI